MQRLTGLDAMFLDAETPSQHMNILGTLVLDPSTSPTPFSFERFRAHIEARLPAIPVLKWKLYAPPLGLSHGMWVEDEEFDLDYHVRHATLPAPGDERALAEFTASVASRKLDRARPLWEIWFVDGLEDGHVAIVGKLHHAKADGAAGLGVLAALFDLDANAPSAPTELPPKPGVDASVAALAGMVVEGAADASKAAWSAVTKFASFGTTLMRRLRPSDLDAAMPFTGPQLSFNKTLSPDRSVAFVELDLTDVKYVKNAFGAKVNDVVLTVIAGALRRYLLDRGELPDRPLVALVPKSVRTPGDDGQNVITSMFSSLHVEIADPARRLRMIQRKTDAAKEVQREVGDTWLAQAMEAMPPNIVSAVMGAVHRLRIMDRTPATFVNLVASNVAGPPVPVYFAGARLVQLYPMGPVIDGTALNITVVSYIDRMFAGILADAAQISEPEVLQAAMNDALAELVKVAQRYSPA